MHSKSIKIPTEFQECYYSEIGKINLQASRFITLIAPILLILFFFTGIDYLYYNEGYLHFLTIRIVVASIMLCFHMLTYIKAFTKYSVFLSSFTFIVAGLGIAIMIRKIGYDSPYYAGLNLAYLGTLLIPYSIRGTLYTCITIYLFYIFPILLFDFDQIEMKSFLSNNQFQLFTIIIAISINYLKFKTNKNLILNRLTIQKQSEELKTKEDEKNQFMANITHDLKTPLSIISGHTDILRDSFEEDNTESKYLNYIGNSVTQINHLLDMLISTALLEQKNEKPNLELYDYPLFVKNFCSHFSVQGERRGIAFLIESLDERIVVSLDSIWVERIIGNLIQNSFKFTGKGGSIKIRLSRDNEYIFTEVIDTGAGIPPEKLPHIFERKYQAHDEQKHLGYGLGLAIAKEMVARLGGSIDAFSREGEGTTVRFSFPIYCDQFAVVKNTLVTRIEKRSGFDRRLENRIKILQDKIEQDAQIDKIKINIGLFENISPSLPSILMCEDNHGQLHLLIEGLKNNFNLVIAENGKEGLQKLDIYGSKISCIISDVRMPEMDGFEFCRRVFEQEQYRHIPFIFLTSYTNEREQLKGLSYGATDYLQKPFNRSILIEKLNHWLSRREHEQILENLVTTLENKNEQICKLRSIISHEIRNPLMILNSVHYNFSKLKALYYDETNEKVEKYWRSLDTIYKTMEIISGVLDSAKIIESGIAATSLKKEPVAALLDNAFYETAHLRPSVRIQINNPFTDEFVLCDRQLLTQVFVNLIRNACEAISEAGCKDGLIEINVRKKDSDFYFSISDNGAGIPETTQHNLFQYNFTTKKDGTGIGLYFSKRILKVHDGDILVESRVGKGTTFTVVIPWERSSEKVGS